MKLTLFAYWLLCSCYLLVLLAFPSISHANQIEYLDKLMKSRRSDNPPNNNVWPDLNTLNNEYTPVYIGPQDGLMKADKIDALPGQPEGVNFDQYSGYVTVDPTAGRALFYYFVESPQNSSTNPLVLWLNGGPGCSSLIGAMEELGPFRVNSDGKTLYRNDYAWNNVANVIFLESPAGIGFSYSNTSSDYDKSGDINTAKDSYTFLVNWLERFPQYKTRDFYITGESYSGHYVPQLAYKILMNNKNTNQTVINLKSIAIGNAVINDYTDKLGRYDFYWSHALNSDETNIAIHKYCEYPNVPNEKCDNAQDQSDNEMGDIDNYHIYAHKCHLNKKISNHTKGSVHHFDPCTAGFVYDYLNLPELQKAFHANLTTWSPCWPLDWKDSPSTILPTIKQLMASNISVWIYSGDMDGRVPVTSSRYSVNTLKLPIKTPWYPWYTNKEVGGFVVEYKGLVFATVRGAGHLVPSYQPERALAMITSFLQGKLPPTRFGH
ncbi:hypothetical protein AQUCO_01500135v1 [Aquilegia coerulea]|uniref:Carboxypeptidase n=1 Tax=Aquilegia coerulea TaxID=218851 RepID=A0A2G5DSA6_AQUCA|nr:hypothetical protein AQUCO_01500135v1 [Aquilegia coerulea]